MVSDVVDLHEFYSSSLGRMARRLIRRRVRRIWPSVGGQRVLGFGYATPFLRPFLGDAERVIAIMPAAQGVMRWPEGEPSL
ncbi:MAG TPA: methyltransferase type 11, partial [Alphaproteobacteria bacterium]|nr:methyltransferase type 11 [Alphaproteobacteria bacterium]